MKIGVYLQMLIVEESDQPDSGPIRVCLGVESIQAKTIQQLAIDGDISTGPNQRWGLVYVCCFQLSDTLF